MVKNKKENRLSHQKNKKVSIEEQRVTLSMQRTIKISSPIPPPEIMKEYNALMPSAMERFFQLAEKQSTHRQEIESIEVKGQNKRANMGLMAGWTTVIIFAIIGGVLLLNDKSIGAYTSFSIAIIPRIASFFIARHDRKKQLENNK